MIIQSCFKLCAFCRDSNLLFHVAYGLNQDTLGRNFVGIVQKAELFDGLICFSLKKVGHDLICEFYLSIWQEAEYHLTFLSSFINFCHALLKSLNEIALRVVGYGFQDWRAKFCANSTCLFRQMVVEG